MRVTKVEGMKEISGLRNLGNWRFDCYGKERLME